MRAQVKIRTQEDEECHSFFQCGEHTSVAGCGTCIHLDLGTFSTCLDLSHQLDESRREETKNIRYVPYPDELQ